MPLWVQVIAILVPAAVSTTVAWLAYLQSRNAYQQSLANNHEVKTLQISVDGRLGELIAANKLVSSFEAVAQERREVADRAAAAEPEVQKVAIVEVPDGLKLPLDEPKA